jgi:phage shock protein A
MPGLKGRLSTVVKSKISKQLDRAENPSETLDYAYSRQVENLQNVKKGIADIATAKKPSSTFRPARRSPWDVRILLAQRWSASS